MGVEIGGVGVEGYGEPESVRSTVVGIVESGGCFKFRKKRGEDRKKESLSVYEVLVFLSRRKIFKLKNRGLLKVCFFLIPVIEK